MSIRDTQFTGFAKALLKEIVDDMLDEYGFMDRRHYECGDLNTTEELIARRAYDLAIEVAKQAIDGNSYNEERDARRILEKLGDLTELPDDDKRYAEMQEEEQE